MLDYRKVPHTVGATQWQRSYARRLVVSDLAVIAVAVFASQFAWFGFQSHDLDVEWNQYLALGYTLVSMIVIFSWSLILAAFVSRDPKIIGSGTLEYRRVADSTIRLFAIFALIAFLFDIGLGRGYFLTAFPLGLALLIITRWLWRQWLRRRQQEGRYLSRAVLVGERLKSEHVAETIRRAPGSGILLVGAVTHDGTVSRELAPGIPVVGGFAEIIRAVETLNADTVILTGADDISPRDMRELGWELDEREVELIVAPALTDVAGPRIHARPVAGLPLIHVGYPSFEGVKRVSKRGFDVAGSLVIMTVASPILIGVAIAVKATSAGPIIYRQERIGRYGGAFGMLKFRSMVQDADDQLESLLDAQGSSDTPLFKVTDDPRITPVGRFIRKYSLDEFPQLINVFLGQMSLVGPRPQRAAEVALYDDAAHRRHIMKPGMSGLWQVSGRSDLSWDDAIRLDLYYVENWSMTSDLIILWRTFRAVAQSRGAV